MRHLFAVVGLLIALYMSSFAVGGELLLVFPSMSWPEATARVIKEDVSIGTTGGSGVAITESMTGGSARPVSVQASSARGVRVSYNVNDAPYTVDVPVPQRAEDGAYAVGSHVPVYHSPRSPGWSTLQRGSTLSPRDGLFVVGLLSIGVLIGSRVDSALHTRPEHADRDWHPTAGEG